MASNEPQTTSGAKLTPEVRQMIVDVIRAGNYVTVAAQYAGIHRATFYRWIKRGRDETEGIYRDFYLAVRQAESFAEVRAVAILQSEMKDNWRAALSYLERKFPDRWGTGANRKAESQTQFESSEENDDDVLYRKIAYYESVFERLDERRQTETSGDAGRDDPQQPVDSP